METKGAAKFSPEAGAYNEFTPQGFLKLRIWNDGTGLPIIQNILLGRNECELGFVKMEERSLSLQVKGD